MKKILGVVKIVAYPLILSLFVFSQPVISFAEDITITTYYPSPAGYYQDLSVNRFLDLTSGAQIRTRATPPVTIMTIFSDHIEFNVPVTFNGNITATGYVRGNLQDRPSGLDVGASLQARWLADNGLLNSLAFSNMTIGSSVIAGAVVAAMAGLDIGASIGFGILGSTLLGLGTVSAFAVPLPNIPY